MISREIVAKGKRRWLYYGRDKNRKDYLIDTNQYLVEDNGKGLLTDPGGLEIFPEYISILSKDIDMERLEAIFASHQDPDIVSSLSLWLEVCPQLKTYVPSTWSLFIPHFGGGSSLTSIPDAGINIPLGSSDLVAIPAHYVHSSGNFSLYDPALKVLFSGDIGAALLPKDDAKIFVEDFDSHVQFMEGFHKRWMPSNRAKNDWVRRVRELDVTMMCPQHGCIFRGDDVKRFLDWFEALEVGNAIKKP